MRKRKRKIEAKERQEIKKEENQINIKLKSLRKEFNKDLLLLMKNNLKKIKTIEKNASILLQVKIVPLILNKEEEIERQKEVFNKLNKDCKCCCCCCKFYCEFCENKDYKCSDC